ncbi:ATP-binding cassette domain-containing protein [Phenylobacterium sp.]|uniref:ABC transporter ATP-binding protein n=1 Tax=Phenylobacterium sp. TaxID=1871053 RepID=UPI00260A212F|nr:ATP-binding cassette domain-containing protein [Phenylobacterium sp.]
MTARLAVENLKSPLAGPFELELAPGECAAISGPSGAGKSLFLRMIADLDPNTGEAALDGTPRAAMAAPAWRRKAPYVAAESGWWRDAVAEHVEASAREAGRDLAAQLGLARELFEGPVQRLSTGERQRLALVRALVLEPPVLLLDEPTAPLDPDSIAKVEAVLAARLKAGAALVLVSHDPQQARRLGARPYEMRERRLRPLG